MDKKLRQAALERWPDLANIIGKIAIEIYAIEPLNEHKEDDPKLAIVFDDGSVIYIYSSVGGYYEGANNHGEYPAYLNIKKTIPND